MEAKGGRAMPTVHALTARRAAEMHGRGASGPARASFLTK